MKTKEYIKLGTPIFSRDDGTEVLGYSVYNSIGSITIRLHVLTQKHLCEPIELTMNQLKNKIFEIQRYAQFNPVEISQIIQKLSNLYPNLQPVKAVENLGWQRDANQKIVGYVGPEVLDSTGKATLKDPYAKLPDSIGRYDTNRIQSYLSGGTKRQIIFFWSLSSVICGLLNKTIWLNVYALSSKGKTISTKLAQSSFCGADYSPLCKTWASTEMALVKSMDGLNGIPILIDDTQLSKIKSYQKIIYELTNGKSILRLVKGNQLSKEYTWATSIISTSENSILETCNGDEGVLPRLLEMPIYQNDLFDDAKQANSIEAFMKANYGQVSSLLVRFIIKNSYIKNVEQLYTKEITSIRKLVTTEDTVLQRCIENIAVITLTAKIAADALELQFRIPDIRDLLLRLYKDSIKEYRESQDSNVILTQMYPQIVEFAKNECATYQRNNYIVIESKKLNELFSSLTNKKLKPITIKRTLAQTGLIFMPRGSICDNFSFNGKSVRGLAIIIDPKDGESDE